MSWQTIDSAPKDGTGILITGGTFDNSMSMAGPCPYDAVTIAHYCDGSWQGENSGGHDEYYWHEPTHWMPLPAPPGADPGIPIYASRDATDDVLGKG